MFAIGTKNNGPMALVPMAMVVLISGSHFSDAEFLGKWSDCRIDYSNIQCGKKSEDRNLTDNKPFQPLDTGQRGL